MNFCIDYMLIHSVNIDMYFVYVVLCWIKVYYVPIP